MQTTDAGMCNKKKKLEKSEISLSGPEMKSKRCRRQTSKPAQKKPRGRKSTINDGQKLSVKYNNSVEKPF